MTRVWMNRAGREGEREDFLIENGVTGSGWAEIPDLSGATTFEQVRSVIGAAVPGQPQRNIGNWAGQLSILRFKMALGDFVLMPRKRQGSVAIGVVSGEYRFDASAEPGFRHLRGVDWLAPEVPRTSFSTDLRNSLGSLLTICEIQRDNVVARIDSLAKGQGDPDFTDEATAAEEVAEASVETAAAVSIEELIRRHFPAHALAELVEAVLQANGYETRLSPPGPDQGVDVLAAKGGLGFDGPRIAVQVKNTGAAQGVPAINELLGAQSAFGADRALFVSWGGYTTEATRMARTKWFDLRLWNAEDLVREVTAVYDALPERFRAQLPLKQVWTSAVAEAGEGE